MRVVRLLADRGGGLESDEEEDAEEDAAEHAAARDPEPGRLARVEHGQRDPVLPALRDDHDSEDQHRHERDGRERQHRANGDAHTEVVEDEHDCEPDQAEHPPRRGVVGDVGLPGSLRQQADAEVDAAAAEEQGAEEEHACRQHADPGVRAVGQVLVHGPGSREAAGIERHRVPDGEHTEAGDQDREGRVPRGARAGIRDEAEDQRCREHRPDRERLGDGMDRREVLLPEGRARGGRAGLTHGAPPPLPAPLAPGTRVV